MADLDDRMGQQILAHTLHGRQLPPGLRSQCMYMLILGVAATSLLALGFLSHTIVCLVSTFSRRPVSPTKDAAAETSGLRMEQAREMRPVPGDTEKANVGGASTKATGEGKGTEDSRAVQKPVAVANSSGETPDQKRSTCDRGQQTEEILGLWLKAVPRERGDALPRNEEFLRIGPPRDGNVRTCTSMREPGRDAGSREPETFYIGDDEGDSGLVSSASSSSDDLLLLASASGERNSLVW
ncbi:conserved hypothetical protein [Neospora caninum Liverpool]|nr:conserved hypothetical protein [Neospora caninum Liverpool]CBZ49547.1 conserved hypothetical protein [Neospora caninum Liverpool]|eukprot:XP_003879582.1 conserved hypothetical protein [Neospora caninum Liverpool]